jgi:hypothetical protein
MIGLVVLVTVLITVAGLSAVNSMGGRIARQMRRSIGRAGHAIETRQLADAWLATAVA